MLFITPVLPRMVPKPQQPFSPPPSGLYYHPNLSLGFVMLIPCPFLASATGHIPARTPATLCPAPSPSGRAAACSELCKHPVVSTTPRVHPGPGELTCCSSFQRDEESCKFPWPALASPPGNFSRAPCWEQ